MDCFSTPPHAPRCMPARPICRRSEAADGTQVNNFDGDITDVFSCIANLGDHGCGFEHQLEATRLSLERALSPGRRQFRVPARGRLSGHRDAHQRGRLFGSLGLDPVRSRPAQSLRPPGRVELIPLQRVRSPVRRTKPAARRRGPAPDFHVVRLERERHWPPGTRRRLHRFPLLPQALGIRKKSSWPPSPVRPHPTWWRHVSWKPASEWRPSLSIQHSCTGGTGNSEYADPAVRIRQMVSAFGPNSYFGSICADDFGPTMHSIAQVMVAP